MLNCRTLEPCYSDSPQVWGKHSQQPHLDFRSMSQSKTFFFKLSFLSLSVTLMKKVFLVSMVPLGAKGHNGSWVSFQRCCVRSPLEIKDKSSLANFWTCKKLKKEKRREFEPPLKAVFKQRSSISYKDTDQVHRMSPQRGSQQWHQKKVRESERERDERREWS